MAKWEEIQKQLQQKSAADGDVGFERHRGYHLEFRFKNVDEARALCDELAQHDIFAKLTTTTDNETYRVYIKDSDSICNLLALAGANKSLLKLHDQIALRSVRNTSNRRANCDTANINKQIEAASKQVEIIKNLKYIPPELRETAQARLDNPEASYEELGKILGLSKSCVVHRLRRL